MNAKCLADRELRADPTIAVKPEELAELLRLAGRASVRSGSAVSGGQAQARSGRSGPG